MVTKAALRIAFPVRKMIQWRCFSEGQGRVLSEEEKAAENVYIKKMEQQRMEKLKKKLEEEEKKKEAESKDKPSS